MSTPDLPPFSEGAFGRSIKRTRTHSIAQFCAACGTRFHVRPADDGLYVSCSIACDRLFPRTTAAKRPLLRDAGRIPAAVADAAETAARAREAAIVAAARHPERHLTDEDINDLRARIAGHVREQLELAHQYVMAPARPPGRGAPPAVSLNAQQVRIFTALLNKVVPDLTANAHSHRVPTKPVNEMTRAELEALVSSASESLHDIRAAEARLAHDADPDADPTHDKF